MMTVPELTANALGSFLSKYMSRRYGSLSQDARVVELVPSIARIALEFIGNSDALYHNVEHTMLVTLAGHDILRGRALLTHMPAIDYAHLIVACLTHDIGYVRGILPGDDDDGFVINEEGKKIKLPRGSSDAALLLHHVNRSKLFIMKRLEGVDLLDAARIARAVEGSRFPVSRVADVAEFDEEVALLRAADLIGQLGDPHYIRKANALYYEFEESGLNRQLGYDNPADLVNKYPQFYWNNVAPHVQAAIRYLNVTASGRQWIANLHSNIFRAERDIGLCGPQK
ncbi:MAG: HD domain-containing protein [Hyphomicrobiales bacterium]